MAIQQANIGEIYSYVQFICNKEQKGYITSREFNATFNTVQLQLFEHFYGPVEQYQPGRPVPRIAFAMSQAVHDALAPFISDPQPITLDAQGKYTLPDDFVHPIALRNRLT